MNTDEVGAGDPTEVGNLRTEERIGNIGAETTLLYPCNTDSEER